MASNVIYFAYLFIIVLMFPDNDVEAAIGVTWGRNSAQRLIPSNVVDLLLQNGVQHARIFSANKDVLEAFAGSGIDLTVSIYESKFVTSVKDAKKWVQERITAYPNSNIRLILFGNQFGWAKLNNTYGRPGLTSVVDSMMFVHQALDDYGYGDKVKLTIPQPVSVLKDLQTRPSDAEFRDDLKEDMARLVHYLKDNNAPFYLDFLLIDYINETKYDLSFAFCDNKSTQVVTDPVNGFVYTNAFELVHDSFVWAIKKVGVVGLKIVIGTIGWATDGASYANPSNAERFYKSFLPYVSSNKGTPMQPGSPIDVYLHSLTDENKMFYISPFSRHWGIYRSNGEPKYKIDLTGQGRDIFPTTAKGIMHMPKRWCVYNNGANDNMGVVMNQFETACNKSDCTSLSPGGSCSQLNFAQNISYAFNMYFQFNFQDEKACDFKGLGKVITTNPSIGSCLFRVDVVEGVQNQMYTLVVRNGCKLHEVPIYSAIILVLLSTLLALF